MTTSTTAVSSLEAEISAGAIRAAEEGGAARSPRAAVHLQLAKEQLEHARKLTRLEDQESADRLFRRAQADAELSMALARSETATAEAQLGADKLKALNDSGSERRPGQAGRQGGRARHEGRAINRRVEIVIAKEPPKAN